jgi:hypothetical protein
MINHMMSAHRLSDVRHSQLLGRLSLPARRDSLAAVIRSMSVCAHGSGELFHVAATQHWSNFKERESTDARFLRPSPV